MPLGEQFRNTYWEDKEGNTRYALDKGGLRPEYTSSSSEVEKPTQGMLFDPYTGTGRKEDPSTPIGTRQAVASRSLNSTDKRLTEHLVNSSVPISTIRNNISLDKTESVPSSGKYLGLYYQDDNRITISEKASNPQNVLLHEIGHHLDPSIHRTNGSRERFPNGEPDYLEDTQTEDPVTEGKADGFADRHSTFSDVYEHKIKDAVTDKIKSPSDDSGYGINHRSWSWTTHPEGRHTNQALYAATRIVSSTGDSAGADIPVRGNILREHTGSRHPPDFSTDGKQVYSNKALLGHLVSTNPGLLKNLYSIHPNLGRAAKAAHQHLKGLEPANMTSRKLDKEASGEQLKLEGI